MALDTSDFVPDNSKQQLDTSDFVPDVPSQDVSPLFNTVNTAMGYVPNVSAIYREAFKNVGQNAIGLANKGIDLINSSNADVKNPNLRFNIPQIPNVFKNYNLDQEQQNPFSSLVLGKSLGNLYSTLPTAAFNPFGTTASGLAKAAQFIGNAGAQSALAQGISNPNSSGGDYLSAAIQGPIYQKLLGTIFGAGARAANVTKADAEQIKSQADALYDAAHSAAKEANYRTFPSNAEAYAQQALSELRNGTPLGEDLSSPAADILDKALKGYQSLWNGTAKPGAFTLKDTHDQMRRLGDKIEQLYKAGDSTNAGIVQDLRNAFISDIEPSVKLTNNQDLADKFFKAQNFYRTEVVPSKEFPTSGKGVLSDLLYAKALGGLPEPVDVAIGAASGKKGLLQNIANAGHRFGSTMQGGPGSVLSYQSPLARALANQLATQNSVIGPLSFLEPQQ